MYKQRCVSSVANFISAYEESQYNRDSRFLICIVETMKKIAFGNKGNLFDVYCVYHGRTKGEGGGHVKSIYAPSKVFTDHSKARLLLCFFQSFYFSIVITSLGEQRANLSAFRTFVRFALQFALVCFLLLLVSGKGCGLRLWHSLDFSLTLFYYFCHCMSFHVSLDDFF